MDDHDLVISPLCRKLEIDGHRVEIEIYGSGKGDWILEAVDIHGTSIVWDSTFETDELALKEFQRTVEKEGIESVIRP